MTRSTVKKHSRLSLAVFLGVAAPLCNAISYGIYDTRALAMGGASVAVGSTEQAHFYNPALLSFHDGDEDETDSGRLILPALLAQYSDAGEATADIVADNLDERISESIEEFNNDQSNSAAASSVLAALDEFDAAIDALNRESIELDAFVGFSVSEPADREGGSFYFGARALAFGRADITSEDLATMDAYIEAMQIIVDGGTTADVDQALVENGLLIDPRPQLSSEAEVSSLAIVEWGLAFAKEIELYDYPVSLGITPKIMRVEVYREDMNFTDDIAAYSENSKSHLTMNFDIGIAAEFYEDFRVGFAVKDVLPKSFSSDNGLALKLRPRSRLGASYHGKYVTVGLDVDLQKNAAVATESDTQEVGVGIELSPWRNIDLRCGYRHDFASERGDVMSLGVRYQIWRLIADASIATGDDLTGGALQLGWKF